MPHLNEDELYEVERLAKSVDWQAPEVIVALVKRVPDLVAQVRWLDGKLDDSLTLQGCMEVNHAADLASVRECLAQMERCLAAEETAHEATKEQRDQFDLEADGNAKDSLELGHLKKQMRALLKPIKVLYDHAMTGDEDNQSEELDALFHAYKKVIQ